MWLLQLFLFISVGCYVGGGQLSMQCPATGLLNSEPCGLSRDADGYEYNPGLGYYKFYPKIMSWYNAKTKCKEDGGHLAIVNSKEEADILARLFAEHVDYHDDWYWESDAYLGASDIRDAGKFITVFGQRLDCTGYTDWAPGVGLGPGDHCLTFLRNKKLNHIHCNNELAFFCEKPLKRFPTVS